MAKGPDEAADLALVEKLIFGASGLVLERFTHAETVQGRTPDYRILQGGEVVGFAEVKSPRDDWLDDQLATAPQGTIVGGARPDPVFNRMARHVEKAATQFDGANKDRLLPNILVFVNHDDASGFGDLVETLTGHFHASDGKRYPTVTHISRRITGAAGTVDLYVWVDVKGQKPSYLFNSDSKHVDTICDLLGIDPRAAVKPVGN